MDKVSQLAHKFIKEARSLGASYLVKKMEKMRDVLEWWKDNSELDKYPFMRGVSPRAVHDVRLSAYSMMQALDKHIIPGLERLDDILGGDDYFELDDNEKKEAAKAYSSLRQNVDEWYKQFSSRYRRPWVVLEQEISDAGQNLKGNRTPFRPAEYFDNNIFRYMRGLKNRLEQFEYLGRSRSY